MKSDSRDAMHPKRGNLKTSDGTITTSSPNNAAALSNYSTFYSNDPVRLV